MKKVLMVLTIGTALMGCDNKSEEQKAADTAKVAVKEATQATKDAAKDAANATKDAAEAAKDAAKDAVNATKDAAEAAKEKVEEKK